MALVRYVIYHPIRSWETHSTLDVSKVLAGIQVPPDDYDAFDEFLKKLNYAYVEETDNPVYKRYLLSPSTATVC